MDLRFRAEHFEPYPIEHFTEECKMQLLSEMNKMILKEDFKGCVIYDTIKTKIVDYRYDRPNRVNTVYEFSLELHEGISPKYVAVPMWSEKKETTIQDVFNSFGELVSIPIKMFESLFQK